MSDTNAEEDPVVSVEDTDRVDPSPIPIVAKVSVKNPRYPDGELIEVIGLGTVPNGGSKDVDFIMATNYEIATGQKWPMKGDKPQDLVIEVKEVSE